MNLKRLSDAELIKSSDNAVLRERESTTIVLHHFKEIERRRLFSAYKFGSLFEMATRHFGYTEDQANLRISAMRILKELPELEEKVIPGELSMTHLSIARTHFRNEEKHGKNETTKEEKLALVQKMENTSKREAQILIQSISSVPLILPKDEVKPAGRDKVIFKFAAEASVESDVKTLKSLLAHKHPELTLGELFEKLCELGLSEWTKAREPRSRQSTFKKTIDCCEVPVPERGAISQAEARRQVLRRDQMKCSNCGSTFALEIDHRIPKAKGGNDTKENLRTLCRCCNQRAAIEQFGQTTMDHYLN